MHTTHSNSGSRRTRRLEPPLGPSVIAASNKEMKTRLSASSLILGNVGPEMRDWSLSSTQQRPTGAGALDPAQRAINTAMKQGELQALSTHNESCDGRLCAAGAHMAHEKCGGLLEF